jgi:hypothetical protein
VEFNENSESRTVTNSTGKPASLNGNRHSNLSIPQIAGIRAAIDAPIDFYVEAPDNIGGFIRHYEVPELIRVAAPVYLKFGLRNAPDVYPAGTHIENTVLALSRERVRRAEIAMGIIARYCPEAEMSPLRAKDLGIPVAVHQHAR